MEPLDQRTLLAVTFKFTILDPDNRHKSIRPQLQKLLDAAGAEWATHLVGTASLEYNIGFVDKVPPGEVQLAAGASKTAELINTDPQTGQPIYQLGTALEIIDGVDRNGKNKPDGGITIYAPYLSLAYFESNTNARNEPIPEGKYDMYTVILRELGHSLGFQSRLDPSGQAPASGIFTYDQHVSSFGTGLATFTGNNAVTVYGTSVFLQIGNPSLLGTGRTVFDPGFRDQLDFLNFFNGVNFFFNGIDDLGTDLMAGVLVPGDRRTISTLDLAILKDAQTPVKLNLDSPPVGIFTVNGTGLPDVIDVSLSNGTLLIRVNNAVQSFNPTQGKDITGIVINGLNGNDTIRITENGPKVSINGGTGNDTIYGEGGSDKIRGDTGSDYLDGGVQGDRINGGSSGDTLVGATGNDFLFGDPGNDLLIGAGGKDRMDGGIGADEFRGGAGNDSVDYSKSSAAVVASIDGSPDDGTTGENDNIMDAENIIGSSFDDALIGSEGPNSLMGGSGNDTVEGGGGDDTLEGNNGLDVLVGGGGNDSLLGGAGNDRLVGSEGLDFLFGDVGDDIFITNDGEVDTPQGGDGNDSVTGDLIDHVSEIEVTDLV